MTGSLTPVYFCQELEEVVCVAVKVINEHSPSRHHMLVAYQLSGLDGMPPMPVAEGAGVPRVFPSFSLLAKKQNGHLMTSMQHAMPMQVTLKGADSAAGMQRA